MAAGIGARDSVAMIKKLLLTWAVAISTACEHTPSEMGRAWAVTESTVLVLRAARPACGGYPRELKDFHTWIACATPLRSNKNVEFLSQPELKRVLAGVELLDRRFRVAYSPVCPGEGLCTDFRMRLVGVNTSRVAELRGGSKGPIVVLKWGRLIRSNVYEEELPWTDRAEGLDASILR